MFLVAVMSTRNLSLSFSGSAHSVGRRWSLHWANSFMEQDVSSVFHGTQYAWWGLSVQLYIFILCTEHMKIIQYGLIHSQIVCGYLKKKIIKYLHLHHLGHTSLFKTFQKWYNIHMVQHNSF